MKYLAALVADASSTNCARTKYGTDSTLKETERVNIVLQSLHIVEIINLSSTLTKKLLCTYQQVKAVYRKTTLTSKLICCTYHNSFLLYA